MPDWKILSSALVQVVVSVFVLVVNIWIDWLGGQVALPSRIIRLLDPPLVSFGVVRPLFEVSHSRGQSHQMSMGEVSKLFSSSLKVIDSNIRPFLFRTDGI